jgi:acyl transferase domain-containing protein
MNNRDVAVVGMACVFPDAADLSSYWRNLVNGVDAIRDLPPERWAGSRNLDLPPDHAGHISCRRGGFVPMPFLFDSLRFKVMPNVARDGDVDQFVILRVLADALEDAGIAEEHASRRNADVIVGRGVYHSNKMAEIFVRADLMDRLRCYLGQRFPQLGENALGNMVEEIEAFLPSPDVDTMATAIPNLVASRAANRLDLRGTAYMVDAACASSLLAVEHGVRRLREGLCDVALACGANFSQVPSFWYLFTQIRAVSLNGQIRPFDRDADGLVIGEGAGAVVLKRLADARRDGDRVYAVVRGAGSSSDGRDVGILAPSSPGQVLAFQRAYDDAGTDPDSIGLLEAHGTGTLQGDATELRTIKTFFGSAKTRHATRAMGSVKSMIGHTMPAAGIASFIKTVLALSNKVLPPSLHCERPHPELEDAPFYVNTHSRPWMHPPGGAPRRAGVSAFGFGGINSHVVLEEAVPGCRARAQVTVPDTEGRAPDEDAASPLLRVRDPLPALDRPSELLAFTGKTPVDVAHQLRRAARFLTEDQAPHSLEDLAYTLVRDLPNDSPCRLACVVESLGPLPERLAEIARRLEAGENPDAPHEMVFYRGAGAPEPGAVAAVFPGLGFPGLVGHYPDHLMTSCLHFPPARECLDRVEHRDDHGDDPLPTSFLLQPPSHLSEAERSRLRHRFTIVLGEDEGLPRPDERKLSAPPGRAQAVGHGHAREQLGGLERSRGVPDPVRHALRTESR